MQECVCGSAGFRSAPVQGRHFVMRSVGTEGLRSEGAECLNIGGTHRLSTEIFTTRLSGPN